MFHHVISNTLKFIRSTPLVVSWVIQRVSNVSEPIMLYLLFALFI